MTNAFQRLCATAIEGESGLMLFVIAWMAMVLITITVATSGIYSFTTVLFGLLAPYFATECIIQIARGSKLDAAISFAGGVYFTSQLLRAFEGVDLMAL